MTEADRGQYETEKWAYSESLPASNINLNFVSQLASSG